MIVGNNKNIGEVYFQDKSLDMIYLGDTLVFQKQDVLAPFIVRGKFTDESTKEKWHLKLNGSIMGSQLDLDISQYVNPDTKEFEVTIGTLEDVTTLHSLFYYNDSIEKVSFNSDLKNIKNIVDIFYYCTSLKEIQGIENWNVGNINNMSSIFYECKSLNFSDLSKWNVENVTTMSGMFTECLSLTSLDLSNWNIQKVKNMGSMFTWCTSLQSLDLSNWNFENVTSLIYIFNRCSKLTDVTGTISNIKISIDLSYCPLTNDSAMVFINGLAEIENNQTITFSKQTYNTLSEAQKKIATDKGWTIAS